MAKYFASTDSKSRRNFLQVLQGTQPGYAINETALAYFQKQALAQAVVAKLSVEPCQFASEAAWQARLAELKITAKLHVRIATEGALLGQIIAQGVAPNLVILSDGAPQFDLLIHASCWIHGERPLARLVPYHEEHREAVEQVRQQIWELYRDLKEYRAAPDPTAKPISRTDDAGRQDVELGNLDAGQRAVPVEVKPLRHVKNLPGEVFWSECERLFAGESDRLHVDSFSVVTRPSRQSLFPQIVVALTQPAPDFHRHVQLRHVLDTRGNRNQYAKHPPLVFVRQRLFAQELLVVGQPRCRDAAS